MRSPGPRASIPHVAEGERFPPLVIEPGMRVFVLTGAGISAESGLRTFRDADGLWENHRVEDVATPEAWQRNPGLVWRFYSERRAQAGEARPNPAHLALAQLGAKLGDDELFLCTQNVDPLHEQAGSARVCHMHGELLATRCESCNRPPFHDAQQYLEPARLPRCACGGRLRPHIVWFGEIPLGLDAIGAALSSCDLFVTVGSSGAVYPAAGFVSHLRNVPSARTGRFARTVYVGLEPPDNRHAFDECRIGKAGALLPQLFDVRGRA